VKTFNQAGLALPALREEPLEALNFPPGPGTAQTALPPERSQRDRHSIIA